MPEDSYNVNEFPVESDVEDFERFPDVLKVGLTAPDTLLTELESGKPVSLRDFTRSGITILEFGSLT